MNEGKVKLKIECNVVSFYVLFFMCVGISKAETFYGIRQVKIARSTTNQM